MKRDDGCPTCGRALPARAKFVLVTVWGWRRQAHCSAACLEQHIGARRAARAVSRRRLSVGLSAAVVVLSLTGAAWRRFHAQRAQTIAVEWPELPEPDAPPPKPIVFGPPWPPTDEQWIAVFDGARGVFPLPGPNRRDLSIDTHILGLDPGKGYPPRCREDGRCGVELGGELWGEHVYAALDGVVDRVVGGDDERRGGHFVRLSHFGGMVFTQYFHLAATPRGVVRGAHVKAGDVIGLVGDTGLESPPHRHLHFALSIRPSTEFPETYWDPKPWLARWSLHSPAHGTVAGYLPR